MSEKRKTAVFAAVAVVLAAAAYLVVPVQRAPELFDDQGEPFYAAFDPLECTSVEVVEYDKAAGGARVFKVQFESGRWTIPSHQGYPADAKDQLARTATVVNGLKKGAIRSDRERDFPDYGVVDPLSASHIGARGRGKRVTLRARNGNLLCDLIIGERLKDGAGYYVRRPDGKRTYACKIDAAGVSTRFADWVETDLLDLSGSQIQRMVIDRYRVDEQKGTLLPGEVLALERSDEGKWALQGELQENEELDNDSVTKLANALRDLTLVGVRRKPEGLLKALERAKRGRRITLAELTQLQILSSIGYYLIGEDGGLKVASNEGELRVYCKDGVVYTLRFGEVVYGDADEISAAPEAEEAGQKEEERADERAEHRYLFTTVEFDESLLGGKPEEPGKPAETELQDDEKAEEDGDGGQADAQKEYEEQLKRYNEKVDEGRQRAKELDERFADWYYVISAKAFKKLHLSRDDLVKEKKEEDEGDEREDGEQETEDADQPE